jgi:tyrosine-protein phosphatase SIW14
MRPGSRFARLRSVARLRWNAVSGAIAPILFFFLTAPSARAQGTPAGYPELPNFHQVDANLFRGGQPAEGGVARLKSLGVRTIVNLRYEPDLVKAEEAEATAAGIAYYNVPMRGLNRPTDAQVTRILGLIDDPANRPVFVHCKAGSDRTGAIVACYRIARAEWTAERAIREAFDYGMMRIEYAKRAFVRSFSAKLRKAGDALTPTRAAS